MITGGTGKQNPFPGLRPFREDEERFFFGRENQVDSMVNKLAATRFLAVVGASGSGKSSLVNCGLRPALHRGLMASAGPTWRMVHFRPGVNPIHSLATALGANEALDTGYSEDVPIEEIVETYLHQSEKGVVEIFRKARLPEGTNLLVVVDQFEELFRYRNLKTLEKEQYSTGETTIAFVNLLLEARAKPHCPIYIVITMRSDFLGDCSQFYGLPEAINESQYLVPRMTRDERRASIAGPVSVGGAEISPVLMTRLLNDVGDNPDQLSILQHALNRTWACWECQGAKGELNLQHYMKIGTMAEALNFHADEAFEELKTREGAKICEKLFKALTDLGTDPRGIRRPLKLVMLKEIVGTDSEAEVKTVIEIFREPSRSFLMPPAPEPLEPEKVIDISHESLMRVWERLRRWADDEAISARRYRRLAETAALEKAAKAGLWRDPELQLALDWQEEQAPTSAWAGLYGGDFESAMDFLKKSRSQRDHELTEVVFERHWKRIRLIIILLIAGLFLWRFAAGDFEWLSDKFGYKPNVKAAMPPAESLRRPGPPQRLDDLRAPELQQRFDEVRRHDVLNAAKALAALACLLGVYLLSYFTLDYFGKWIFRRFAFAKILHEVALSSSKAVREQQLSEQTQALGDAAGRLQTTYAGFWRRLGAYVLAFGLFMIGLVAFIAGLLNAPAFLRPLIDSNVGIWLLLIPFVVGWLCQAMMLSSRRQATVGMLVLGIFVTDQNGSRLTFGRASARHFAKVLSYVTLGIGFFIQPFTRKRQTLHDLIARSVVLVRPDKKRVQPWIVVLCVIIGLIGVSLPVGWYAYLNYSRRMRYERYQRMRAEEHKELAQRGADQGDARAQRELGSLYEHGDGVRRDLQKAVELYQKSADQGDARAQRQLGSLYERGDGVRRDLQKAVELYQKSADQGDAVAQCRLAKLFENGEGVPKDLRKAAELFQKAVNQGYEPARLELKRLSEHQK
jgi:uncharacterized RDD family membrane protein YckC/energy-coupling factor transporter ATP-binding protein EcfA2